MILFALCLLAFQPADIAPRPNADRLPAEVVQIVVQALQHHGSPIPNAGIFTAYTFASPRNHALTGPYGRFLGIVKAREFAALLHPYPTALSPMARAQYHAEQMVTIQMGGDRLVRFRFKLSRQGEGPCQGCWMVDTVEPVE